MRTFLTLLLVLVTWFAPTQAADANLAQIESHVSAGMTALREADATPRRIIDAAMSFSQALKGYEQLGDTDKVCEMQANVFWCKKRMNLENLQNFIAAKRNQSPEAAANLEAVDRIADKQVSVSEAQGYFDRAEAYAKLHPKEHLLVAVRWFEVAKRFVGSEIAIKAQDLSTDALLRHTKSSSVSLEAKRETLFTKPAVTVRHKRVALPDAAAQREALASLKAVYKNDFLKAATEDKVRLATRLLDEGSKTQDEPAIRWALLSEAARLAAETEQYHLMLDAADILAASFTGVDAKAEKKARLAKSGGSGAGAMAKLIDNPDDAEANLIAGNFFCFKARRLDLGLPLWTRCKDAGLNKLAEQELLKPGGAPQQVVLGDGWYELGKKAGSTADRAMCYERARTWYHQALSEISGFTKEKAAARIAEIDKVVPPPIGDFSVITPAQWDGLKCQTLVVPARIAPGEVGVTLNPGQSVRVVPHPTEKWNFFIGAVTKSMTHKGMKDPQNLGWQDGMFGAMTVLLEGNPVRTNEIIRGPGRILIGAEMLGATMNNSVRPGGSIRVKIVPVTE